MFSGKTKTAKLNGSNPAKAAAKMRFVSTTAASAAAQNAAAAAQNAANAAQAAAQNATVIAQNAAKNAASAAQAAAQNAAVIAQSKSQYAGIYAQKGVRRGIHRARNWAAPQLENAASYYETTFTPKVSSALRGTARQVRVTGAPSKRRSALKWSLIGAAVVAAVGAAAAVVRYRYRASMTAQTQPVVDSKRKAATTPPTAAEQRTATTATPVTQANPAASSADTSVNGRVSSTGW